MKITKIGGSNWLLVPSEFIKVFNISDEVEYEFSVEKKGDVLIYKLKKEEGEDEKSKSK